MKYPPLTDSLPAPLNNGQRISAFAKHCPACQTKVEARHMHGLARPVEGRVILAAKAQCPQCGHRFNVACVIDEQKKVSRLWLPAAFMMWWLSTLKSATPISEPLVRPIEVEITPELSEESLGSYGGKPIPAWLDWQGRRYRFERVDGGGNLQPYELRYAGLVFRQLVEKA